MNSLHEDFDDYIIGKTVGPYVEQLVYSLTGLLMHHNGDREAIGLLMKEAFTAHGAEAPVFVDDWLKRGPQNAPDPDPDPTPPPPVIITDNNPKVIPPFPGTRIPTLHR